MKDADEVLLDEHGLEVRSLTKKVIEPRPWPEDLTRVRVGPEPQDYLYVDPVVLFQLHRLVPDWVGALRSGASKSQVYQRTKAYPKYTRDVAERVVGDGVHHWWPAGGYLTRHGDHLVEPSEVRQAIMGVAEAQAEYNALCASEDGAWVPVHGLGEDEESEEDALVLEG